MKHRAGARNSKKGNENTEINLDKDKRFCENVRHTHTNVEDFRKDFLDERDCPGTFQFLTRIVEVILGDESIKMTVLIHVSVM